MKRIITLSLMLVVLSSVKAQIKPEDGFLHWSATRKLQIEDFNIKTNGLLEGSGVFAQFSINFKLHGFDFMTRNFNKKVENRMIKSASWIDTTGDVSMFLRYEQTLFDLSEIYTRRFRKDLKANRKAITTGLDFANKLNDDSMKEFAIRRLSYDAATNYGSIPQAQLEWEATIMKELEELKEYGILEK